MPKTFEAPFAQNKKTLRAVCTAAKTTYADNANAVLLGTVGSEGGLLRRLTAIARAANISATQLQLYRSSDGVTLHLCDAITYASYSVTATSTGFPKADFGLTFAEPLGFEPNEQIWVGIGVALAAGIAFTGDLENF
ncbi:hypothetical protein [Aureimonas sp. SK2]|uniref:hypothetical protein n=1 Tax=Aureimonas sp. SK2 TaxID=3015992 RepID=UPI0024451AA1|nr:hypothetical protein [Aureimonas sp. SK2]